MQRIADIRNDSSQGAEIQHPERLGCREDGRPSHGATAHGGPRLRMVCAIVMWTFDAWSVVVFPEDLVEHRGTRNFPPNATNKLLRHPRKIFQICFLGILKTLLLRGIISTNLDDFLPVQKATSLKQLLYQLPSARSPCLFVSQDSGPCSHHRGPGLHQGDMDCGPR